MRRALTLVIASLSFLAVGMVVSSGSASAGINNQCFVGAFQDNCLFWGQSYFGGNSAKAGTPDTIADFANPATFFPGPGQGAGTRLWNNVGSDINGDTVCAVTLWYNQNFGAPTVTMNPFGTSGDRRAGGQLGPLLNDNRSQSWNC